MKKVPEGLDPIDRSPYCGDPGALVSYLYNDGSSEELAAIATHVQSCDACTAELAALGDTRELISTWSPPQTELGLTLSSDALPIASATPVSMPSSAAPVADAAKRGQVDFDAAKRGQVNSVPWWRQATPVWMQAVAATMVFAAGMAIGANRAAEPASRATAANSGAVTPVKTETALKADSVSRGELADLERRLRAELARLSPSAPAQPAPVQTAARTDDEAVMKRVRALLSESEEKQRGELALRTAQVLRDIEIQRKVDIATLQQNIGQIQGVTGAELRQQRELTNQLINRVGLQGR
jgi:hypothetical protein